MILLSNLLDQGILHLELNDPARRNALSQDMLETLHAAILSAGENMQVRVIVLAANGPAFCAGHDLKEITAARGHDDQGRAFFTHLMDLCGGLMQAVVTCPKPVIAQVQGVATAAGCQLVASCDLAVAGQSAKFATPGVNIGLFCSTPMVALSRNVSNKHAMEMLLTGEMVSAERAEHIGLVNQVVSDEELEQATQQLAEKIAAKSSQTLAVGKGAFYRQRELGLPEAYAYASEVMVQNMLDDDAVEGIGAFVEKRAPNWNH